MQASNLRYHEMASSDVCILAEAENDENRLYMNGRKIKMNGMEQTIMNVYKLKELPRRKARTQSMTGCVIVKSTKMDILRVYSLIEANIHSRRKQQ